MAAYRHFDAPNADTQLLCLKCPLPACDEESSECLINIAKVEKSGITVAEMKERRNQRRAEYGRRKRLKKQKEKTK